MRRRLNKRLLVPLVVISIAGVLVALIAPGAMARRRSLRFTQYGDVCLAQHHYSEAAAHFARAIALRSGDAELFIKYGDALHEMARSDTRLLGKDRDAW